MPSPYRYSTSFNLQPLHTYLKFQVRLIDLCQSDIQKTYNLQKDMIFAGELEFQELVHGPWLVF